jgi:Mrp family chromosome partitioning ATPase
MAFAAGGVSCPTYPRRAALAAEWARYPVPSMPLTAYSRAPKLIWSKVKRGDLIMPNRNQDSRCAARIVLCAALLFGLSALFATSTTRAEDDFRKICKVGMTVSALETDGNATSCRALALQANAQNYQLGCQSAEAKDVVMLTMLISINEKSPRLTSSSLVANTENAKHAPEELTACAKVWHGR